VIPAGQSFEGRGALVTGGASGIGAAVAELLAARGAGVVVADLDGSAGAATVARITADGGRATFVRTDVTQPDDVAAMVAAAVDAYGRLDVAVNNAGTPGTYAPLADQDLAGWERTLAVNLTSVFLCLKAEVAAMLAPGPDGDGAGGSIVNTASAAGLMGFANLPAYVASKHGVVGLTKSVALEQARRGIRVNVVCPGNVRTPMLEGFAGDEASLLGMGKLTPIGRLGTPAEIAEAIVWLCSDAASYVTGHAFAVDGGVLAT
jgi:NAD(P)-dependent dehydrogenase (short-subunit alcohol dehydrogenase family)